MIYHLVVESELAAGISGGEYRPARFALDGFIHCAGDEATALEVARSYFHQETETVLVLRIDVGLLSSPCRFEPPAPLLGGAGHRAMGKLFPHVHGPLNLGSVNGVGRLARGASPHQDFFWPRSFAPLFKDPEPSMITASIGNADLPYNTFAAALEGSAKAAGLSRASSPEAKQIEVTLVEYEGLGAWLRLDEPGTEVSKMLAAPLAKGLRRGLTLFTTSEAETLGFRVDPSGKLEPITLPEAGSPASGAAGLEAAMNALLGVDEATRVVNRQKRTYWHKPTTGNARLDRFIEAARGAEKVEVQKEAEGRYCIRLLLSGGIKQMSYFNEKELEVIREGAKLTV